MFAPRLRFAPSPTGYLHIGGARTALFNWLYARRHGGVFVLRIEDTDVQRSSWDMVSGIVDGLRWLGLEWDEGPDVGGPHAPYFQSERLDKYRAMAEQLVIEGRAYYCYCSAERLQQKREEAEAEGAAWMYDRACLRLAPDQIAEYEASAAPRAIRFRVPAGTTRFRDLVHGEIHVDHTHIEDFVLLRSDRHPTYHLSVVVDDIDMQITHVVRGDDHVSNTPKHVLLYAAFGSPAPHFAHVPLILGTDRKRLSKRHGATSVMEYKSQGYLPEAMVNFLVLLGWSPGSDQEIFTRDELVRAFSLEGISSANAVFNPEKLDWFNNAHLTRLPVDRVIGLVEPMLWDAGLWSDGFEGPRREWLCRVVELLRPRVRKLPEFIEYGRPFFVDAVEYEAGALEKYLADPSLAERLAGLRDALATADPFNAAATEASLRRCAEAQQVKAAALIHPLRLAVTGKTVSPGIFDVLELVGRDRTIERLDAFETALKAHVPR
jgi:glutamyl-tRNA synthetase